MNLYFTFQMLSVCFCQSLKAGKGSHALKRGRFSERFSQIHRFVHKRYTTQKITADKCSSRDTIQQICANVVRR